MDGNDREEVEEDANGQCLEDVGGRRVAMEWPESQSYCLVTEYTRCSMVSADGRVRRDGDDEVNGNEISGHWDYDHRANRGQSD